MPKLHPFHDRVLVRVTPKVEMTAGGIILPDELEPSETHGIVVEVGCGKPDDKGICSGMPISVGDTVHFSNFARREQYEDCIVLKEEDIFGIVYRQ